MTDMTELPTEDLKEILDLLETHEDYYVIHIRQLVWGRDIDENTAMPCCNECECDIKDGETVYIWGEPFGNTPAEVKAAQYAGLQVYCSEEHVEIYTGRWAHEIGFEEFATAYHR